MNNKRGLFSRVIPTMVILVCASVIITWQITNTYVSKSISEKYDEMLNEITVSNDLSHMMYSVDTIIKSEYVGSVDDEKLLDETISGYIRGLGDKYASYMNANEYSEYTLKSTEASKTAGIGITAVYDMSEGGLYVINVYENTPASKSGILPGETITRVSGVSVTTLGKEQALESLNGERGSTVDVTVKSKENTERIVTLTRERIKVDTVTRRKLNRDTGLVCIHEFSESTPNEFKNAIERLTVSGVERFIFDVRNNPGGNIDGLAEILDFLLPEGNTVIINEKDGAQKTMYSDVNEFEAPMAVLVNHGTASAAELFTAALKDYGKAEIIGEKTYGKGTVQQIVNLPGGRAASISVSTYLPPSGVSYDGIGIVPDHEVLLPEETKEYYYKMTDEQDTQLQKAIEVVADMKVETYQ